jgi:hypothetical protein
MRSLLQSLQDHDHNHLRAIAELWGLDPPPGSRGQMAEWLAQTMVGPDLLGEIIASLPSGRQALATLEAEGGRLAWADFQQRFGAIREMGPARRDRERPWRQPASASEVLYYRGLIGRAFRDTPTGPKEFAYIPDELGEMLQAFLEPAEGRLPPVAAAPGGLTASSSGLVDDATTLLAVRRLRTVTADGGRANLPVASQFLVYPRAHGLTSSLLASLHLIDPETGQTDPERAGPFLTLRRDLALARLQAAWRDSEVWQDFELLTHLTPGPNGWPGDPKTIRAAVLSALDNLPRDTWFEIEALLDLVHQKYPSLLRPGSDFESWYLRDRHTGVFLSGPGSWMAVDGALLRAVILGPLHWLGAADLGAQHAGDPPDRFRLTHWSGVIFGEPTLPPISPTEASCEVDPSGRISMPRAANRRLRYQIARLSSWLSFQDDRYHYRLRPSAVLAGGKQGLKPIHVRQLLESVGDSPVPTTLLRALDRLTAAGIEARMEAAIVLKVGDPGLLDRLLAEPRTARFILARLGPKAASVATGNVDRLLDSAARAGLLIEPVRGKRPSAS